MGADEDFNATGVEYILAKPEEKPVGFYKATEDTTIKAGKAYLVSSSGVKAFFFAEDSATGINSLTPALSEGEGAIYNLAGQRIGKMQKGINIVNGRKVFK
jgi:hypothetical protein